MTRIVPARGAPKTVRVDNGSAFISKVLDRRAYENGVTLDFSRLDKPTDNAFVTPFKTERIARKINRTRDHPKTGLSD